MEKVRNSKTVRLDKELMDTLAEKRKGFETPSDCIKRLLTNLCSNSNQGIEEPKEEQSDE